MSEVAPPSSRPLTRPAPAARERPHPSTADRAWLAAPHVLLVAGWFPLHGGLRWFVNPDGVVYAVLAERLAAGDLAGAVTTYWSPLLPALACPLVAAGVPTLLALRLVLLLAALAALAVVRSLCRRAGATRRASDAATLVAVPVLLAASLFGVYPELLLAVLLLAHCRAVLTSSSTRGAVAAGLLGALAFLAKPVALPFVVGLVVLVALVRLVRPGARRRSLRAAAVTLGVAALLSAPWAAVVSAAAGHPTLSTAGEFNARFTAPGSWGNPMSYPGLYPPAPGATTRWEDPLSLPDLRNAPQVGAPVTLVDRAGNTVAQAAVAAGSLLRRWWVVLPFAALGTVVAARAGWPGRGRRSRGGGPEHRARAQATGPEAGSVGVRQGAGVALGGVVAAVAFTAGMSLLVVIERYLWFPMLALLPAAALGASALAAGRPRRTAVLAVVATALVAASVAPTLTHRWGAGREVWTLADRLRERAPLAGPLAGAQDWQSTQLLAHLSGVPYLGTTGVDGTGPALAGDLERAGARHLVVWGEAPAGLAAPAGGGGVVYDVTADGLEPHRP